MNNEKMELFMRNFYNKKFALTLAVLAVATIGLFGLAGQAKPAFASSLLLELRRGKGGERV